MSGHEMTEVQRECERICGDRNPGWHNTECPILALVKNSAVAVPVMSETKCTCTPFYDGINKRTDYVLTDNCPLHDQHAKNETKIPDDLRHLGRLALTLRLIASEAREQELREENEQLSSKAEIWKNSANCFRLECDSLRAEVERLKLFHGYAEDGKAILAAALQHAQDQHDLKKLRAQLAEMQSKLAQQQQIVLNKGTAILDLESKLADATKPVTDEEWDNHGHAVSETINDSWSDFYKRVANAVLSARAAKGGE